MIDPSTLQPLATSLATPVAGALPAVGLYALRHRVGDAFGSPPGSVCLGREIETRGRAHRTRKRRRDPRDMGLSERLAESARAALLNKNLRIELVDRMLHTQIVAPTGAGKTGVMLPMAVQDLLSGLTVFVLETGGNLGTDLLPYARALGRPVFYFDPGSADTWIWNPLRGDPEKTAERAASTLEAIGGNQEFFKHHNQTVLRAVVMAAHAHAQLTGQTATLLTVSKIATDPRFRRKALGITGDGNPKNGPVTCNNSSLTPAAREFWENRFYGDMSHDERTKFCASLKNLLDIVLFRPRVRKALCPDGDPAEREFDLEEALSSGGLILMRMPLGPTGISTARPLSVWALSIFEQIVFDRAENAYPVMAYFDEIHNSIGKHNEAAAEEFTHFVTQARGFNVGCVFAYQGYQILPESLRVVLAGGARNKIVLGGLDYDDALFVQRLCGDDVQHARSTRRTREPFSLHAESLSTTTTQEEAFRYSIEEIRSLPQGDAICQPALQAQVQYPVLYRVRPEPPLDEFADDARVARRRAARRSGKRSAPSGGPRGGSAG